MTESDGRNWDLTEDFILGIDEAGRGPVLGPMVYASAFCAVSHKNALKKLGVNDSKQLKESERDALLTKISNSPYLGYNTEILTAEYISSQMLAPSRTSLNTISHNAAISLIRLTLSRGIHLTEVYVDTVGDPTNYATKLRGIFPGINKIVVEKQADGKYPIVSTASIVAKTLRDSHLRNWIFKEKEMSGGLAEFSKELGSGYPGDPLTKKWLRDHVDTVFGFPDVVRFGWSTVKKILVERGVGIRWEYDSEDEEEEEGRGGKRNVGRVTDFFGKKKRGVEGKEENENVEMKSSSWLRKYALNPATSL